MKNRPDPRRSTVSTLSEMTVQIDHAAKAAWQRTDGTLEDAEKVLLLRNKARNSLRALESAFYDLDGVGVAMPMPAIPEVM